MTTNLWFPADTAGLSARGMAATAGTLYPAVTVTVVTKGEHENTVYGLQVDGPAPDVASVTSLMAHAYAAATA